MLFLQLGDASSSALGAYVDELDVASVFTNCLYLNVGRCCGHYNDEALLQESTGVCQGLPEIARRSSDSEAQRECCPRKRNFPAHWQFQIPRGL